MTHGCARSQISSRMHRDKHGCGNTQQLVLRLKTARGQIAGWRKKWEHAAQSMDHQSLSHTHAHARMHACTHTARRGKKGTYPLATTWESHQSADCRVGPSSMATFLNMALSCRGLIWATITVSKSLSEERVYVHLLQYNSSPLTMWLLPYWTGKKQWRVVLKMINYD